MNTVESIMQVALGPNLSDAFPTNHDWMETETYTDFIVPVKVIILFLYTLTCLILLFFCRLRSQLQTSLQHLLS